MSLNVFTQEAQEEKLVKKLSGYSKQSGFTLIELMIVIAVIAALAASCIPIMKHFRNRARIAGAVAAGRCVQNSFASFAMHSTNSQYPIVNSYEQVAQVANANGCPMPHQGDPQAPVGFGGFWCYIQDPLTGTIQIVLCDPGQPFEYKLQLTVPLVNDAIVEVDSTMGVHVLQNLGP